MSQLAIYWVSGSPFSWRVLLTADVKGIPYEGKLVQVSKGELKTPEFLAVNPLGRTAEEAGRIFRCISEFISDFEPSNQLFGPPLDSDEAGAEREKAHLGLARLARSVCESGVWMAGSVFTAADIVAYPGLKLLLRVSQRPEAAPSKPGLDGFEPRFPSIAAWMHGRAAPRLR